MLVPAVTTCGEKLVGRVGDGLMWRGGENPAPAERDLYIGFRLDMKEREKRRLGLCDSKYHAIEEEKTNWVETMGVTTWARKRRWPRATRH